VTNILIITKLPFKKKVKKGCQILARSSKKLMYQIKKIEPK